MSGFVVEAFPSKMTYKPGEEISFDGARFSFDDIDVTDDVEYSVIEGTPWRAHDKSVCVIAEYADCAVNFTLKRKRNMIPFFIFGVALVFVISGICTWKSLPEPDTGSYIIPQGDMSDADAQAMLDEQAEKSRITVSISPNPKLADDGQLRVNFIVVEPNNGFAERLEVEQDGNIIYASGVVQPGYKIEWGQSSGAHTGSATATVYAVDGNGLDHGNPVSVEIEIV